MPSDIKECSLYSFTLRGQKVKTTPKDITARAAAEAAQTTANGKQDALTAEQLAAVDSGVTAAKVAAWDSIIVPSITKITHSVQTKSNTSVTPFSAYAEVNIADEISANGSVLSVMAHHASTNPGYGMVYDNRILRVYSARAATFPVDIFYIK